MPEGSAIRMVIQYNGLCLADKQSWYAQWKGGAKSLPVHISSDLAKSSRRSVIGGVTKLIALFWRVHQWSPQYTTSATCTLTATSLCQDGSLCIFVGAFMTAYNISWKRYVFVSYKCREIMSFNFRRLHTPEADWLRIKYAVHPIDDRDVAKLAVEPRDD